MGFRFRSFCLVTGLLLALGAANPAAALGERKPQQVSYLFALEAPSAKLRSVDQRNTKFTLTVPLKKSTQTVTWFTDRPVRDAGHVSLKNFVGLWKLDVKDSFSVDPPNVAMSFGQKILIATMTDPKIVSSRNGTRALVATLTLIQGKELIKAAKISSGLSAHAKRAGDNTSSSNVIKTGNVYFYFDASVSAPIMQLSSWAVDQDVGYTMG